MKSIAVAERSMLTIDKGVYQVIKGQIESMINEIMQDSCGDPRRQI
jgi:hypothetical protein